MRIKELRQERNLSQQKLADLLGINQTTVHNYENGIFEPDIATLKALADFFGTSIDYLVGYTDYPNKVEKTEVCHLNEDEIAHIAKYRGLKKGIQASFDKLMDDFISQASE